MFWSCWKGFIDTYNRNLTSNKLTTSTYDLHDGTFKRIEIGKYCYFRRFFHLFTGNVILYGHRSKELEIFF